MSSTVEARSSASSASSSPPQLGRLERVDPRLAWAEEARDFAPWLASGENLDYLAETLGLDLEPLEPEDGARCRAAVLCRDRRSGARVLVQGQVEGTDDGHLGEMLVDAAALQVGRVVWVAESFSEQHLTTLRWLNSVAANGLTFAGVEVQLWRIEDSMAPRWNVIVRPGERQAAVPTPTPSADGTPNRQDPRPFWALLKVHLEQGRTGLQVPELRPEPVLRFPTGRDDIRLEAGVLFGSHDRVWAAVRFHGADARKAFEQLMLQKDEAQADFENHAEGDLVWDESSRDEQAAAVFVHRRPANLDDRATWEGHAAWLEQVLMGLKVALGARLGGQG